MGGKSGAELRSFLRLGRGPAAARRSLSQKRVPISAPVSGPKILTAGMSGDFEHPALLIPAHRQFHREQLAGGEPGGLCASHDALDDVGCQMAQHEQLRQT